MMWRIVLCGLFLLEGCVSVALRVYNGTTTLDQQATSYSVQRDPARTTVRFPYRPNILYDNEASGGGTLGTYIRPPPRYQKRPLHYQTYANHPPIHHLPHPPKYYPIMTQPLAVVPQETSYVDNVYTDDDECSVLGPLLALKTSIGVLLKLAVAKLPLLALKLLAKGLALLVVLGPILLPLLLLFPVPVFGLNAFGNGIAVTGFGNGFNGNGFNNNGNTGGNNNFNNQGGNRLKEEQTTGRRLPQFARGPCLPRLSCEMGYWGYKQQIAWILDHATETATPKFPKLFNSWKRAYHQGGRGRDCATLYFCPSVDRVLAVAAQSNLLPE